MEGGAVDEFLGVTVERLALDQFKIEIGRASEDRVGPGFAGDGREDRHVDKVDEVERPSTPGSTTGCRASATAPRTPP